MMRHIKKLRKITVCFFAVFMISSCKKNIAFQAENIRSDSPQTSMNTTSSTVTKDKHDQTMYEFFAISKEQLFPIKSDTIRIEKEFFNKIIKFDGQFMLYNGCSTEVIEKAKEKTQLFNGTQNVILYDEILSQYGLKVDETSTFVTPLYARNDCALPSDTFFLIGSNILFFVYEGHVILFKKIDFKINKKATTTPLNCYSSTGNLSDGFLTKCQIASDLFQSYMIFIEESKINEIGFLKKELPTKNLRYTVKDVVVNYVVGVREISIDLSFSGGETIIKFIQQNNRRTEIEIINYPD